jgi:hypothetical protein
MSSPATADNPNITITATFSSTEGNQPLQDALYSSFRYDDPPCNRFNIRSPGATIYGYIQRLVVSQVQIQYDIPTVIPDLNDELYMIFPPAGSIEGIIIPYGYYTPEELAALLQIEIRNNTTAVDMDVTFDPSFGFKFESAAHPFIFADPELLDVPDRPTVYKAYRLLGISQDNTTPTNVGNVQESIGYPNFLYTPYIDILSDTLTNYQMVKDTNTSTIKPKGLIARVYLSGNGNIQPTEYAPNVSGSSRALGSTPFVVTADLNSPKIIKWSPDVAVPNIDFELRDCYGELIPGPEFGHSTEFQMTLLCVEGGEWRGE